jgi:hypothetical protein
MLSGVGFFASCGSKANGLAGWDGLDPSALKRGPVRSSKLHRQELHQCPYLGQQKFSLWVHGADTLFDGAVLRQKLRELAGGQFLGDQESGSQLDPPGVQSRRYAGVAIVGPDSGWDLHCQWSNWAIERPMVTSEQKPVARTSCCTSSYACCGVPRLFRYPGEAHSTSRV